MLLYVTDAARSNVSTGTKLCKSHGAGYRERLKSLQCHTPGCCNLVMTAAYSEDERTSSARLRGISDDILSQHCMVCFLVGNDEIT